MVTSTTAKVSQAEPTLHKSSLDESEMQPLDETKIYPGVEPGVEPSDNQPLPVQESKSRPRSITILALLLFLQAVGLFDFGLLFFDGLGIRNSLMTVLLAEPANTLARGLVFVPLGLLALLAGIGFLRVWRTAWVMAMFLQGLCLLVALVLYFDYSPAYVYILMLYSIVMVIYLNYSEVYPTFQPTSILEEEEEE